MTPSPVRTPFTRIIHDSASGFVLVGVIMFILVLTILGLSLFSLSGFEAQFFNASLHREDAYYTANGGIERAKWVMMRTGSLDKVRENPPEGVIYTVARQGQDFDTGDSTGNLTWNDREKPVWIRALAESHGVKSYVEARFMPTEAKGIYQRLIASHTGVTVVDRQEDPTQYDPTQPGTGPLRWPYTWLTGEVWQNDADTSWTYGGSLNAIGMHPVSLGGVPTPDVRSFYERHDTPQPVTPYFPDLNGIRVDLNTLGGGDPVYYESSGHITNEDHGTDDYGLYGRHYMDIYVRGTVVWLLPKGIDIRCNVGLHGTAADRLIIVARKGGGAKPEAGISLDSFDAKDIPLILVSDGQVELSHEWQYITQPTLSSYLSVFAESVRLMGPESTAGGYKQNLRHDSTRDDEVLGPLYEAAALPNASARDRSLAAIPGTWRQLPTGGLN